MEADNKYSEKKLVYRIVIKKKQVTMAHCNVEERPSKTVVIHARDLPKNYNPEDKRFVYIGRAFPFPPHQFNRSKWANPYRIEGKTTRELSLTLYERDVKTTPGMEKSIKEELSGKILVCWCSPEPCHGDILARIANSK